MCFACNFNNLPQTTYCERGNSTTLLSEPINAFTNLTFLIVGYFSHKRLIAKRINDKKVLILPWMLATVGVGSFLYHTARSPLTLVFDALPIYFFILYTLFLVLKKLFNSNIKPVLVLIGFILLEVLLTISVPKEFLNGSIRHLTALIFITMIGFFIQRRFGKKIVVPIVAVIVLYATAIFFRSADMQLCSLLPFGTHFLWHILAAIAGGFTIELVALLYMPKSRNISYADQLKEWCKSHPKFYEALKVIYSDRFVHLGAIVTSHPSSHPNDEVIGLYAYDYLIKTPKFKQDFIVNKDKKYEEFTLYTNNPKGSSKWVKGLKDFYNKYGKNGDYANSHHFTLEQLPDEIKERGRRAIRKAQEIQKVGLRKLTPHEIEEWYDDIMAEKKRQWRIKKKMS